TDERRWRDAGTRTVRGRLHGYRMPLDLSNWSERLTYCLARYHDLPLQLAMQRLIRPGDTFVDVGANLGMLSLLACRLVGPEGRVIAIEPNPHLGRHLERLGRDNDIHHLQVLVQALGPEPGEAVLHEFAGHSGWGSLIDTAPDGAERSNSWTVPVVRGDTMFAGHDEAAPLVIKIDVEGYEVPALRGLDETLSRRRPLLFLEAVDDNQRRAGFSLDELRRLLAAHGYSGHYLWHRRRGLYGNALEIHPFDACPVAATDALFVPSEGVMHERATGLIRGAVAN
ncbi:MAG: FkbM family methyltransferase, partial [Planctomycetes bacterium]|nr:FkbM family methyltransferase [Planctomycetota bacterium]